VSVLADIRQLLVEIRAGMAFRDRLPRPIVPLAELERRAIEEALEKCGGVAGAARALVVGRATIYRKLDQWRILDKLTLPRLAPDVGVFEDEVECALGRIDQAELARRRSYCQASASRSMDEAMRLLGRRRFQWGLALL
jgi:hypothetical protein